MLGAGGRQDQDAVTLLGFCPVSQCKCPSQCQCKCAPIQSLPTSVFLTLNSNATHLWSSFEFLYYLSTYFHYLCVFLYDIVWVWSFIYGQDVMFLWVQKLLLLFFFPLCLTHPHGLFSPLPKTRGSSQAGATGYWIGLGGRLRLSGHSHFEFSPFGGLSVAFQWLALRVISVVGFLALAIHLD